MKTLLHFFCRPLFCRLIFTPLLLAADGHVWAAELLVQPRVSVVERAGVTGAGQVVAAGSRLLMFYPNHPDDFGGSSGMGASISEDGGATWKVQPDDWPMVGMVDLWADKLRDGSLLAFGIHWVPDSKRRGALTAEDVPADAYQIAISTDDGRTWQSRSALIECPAEFGVIARPLPHTFEDDKGVLFMPAYAWGSQGNHALLLTSADRGRRWTVLSSITTVAAIVKAGAPVTTPWLETTVSPTKSGDFLAIVRTGSNAKSSLVSVRSTDRGKTWSTPEVLPFAGKLPTLQLLPNGVLSLLTAHTKNHCRLYLSSDGDGRGWSPAQVLTSQSGGNAGMTVTGKDSLLIISPANKRIDAWRVSLASNRDFAMELAAPTNITFVEGELSWSGQGASYLVRPILRTAAAGNENTEVLPYAAIATPERKLHLGRQLSLGGTYVFEISAVNREGQVSTAARSAEFVNR